MKPTKPSYRFQVVATSHPEPFDRGLHAGEPADIRTLTLDEVSAALAAGLTLKALPFTGTKRREDPYFPGEVLLPWNR